MPLSILLLVLCVFNHFFFSIFPSCFSLLHTPSPALCILHSVYFRNSLYRRRYHSFVVVIVMVAVVFISSIKQFLCLSVNVSYNHYLFPVALSFCDARRFWHSSPNPTATRFMFCLLLSLFLSEPPQPKTKRTAITIIVRLFAQCRLCTFCLHSYPHTHEQKEVEACFVFDNVISFLLVVCKHFISLKSGIFSLVPQLYRLQYICISTYRFKFHLQHIGFLLG